MMKLCGALLLALTIATTAHGAWPTRGYQGRNCGLDLNHNGVIGEAADCVICTGNGSGTVTVGPNAWTQVYVDCDAGNNANNGLSSAAPKRTLSGGSGAFSVSPSSGAARAICVTGTCTAADGETWSLNPPAGNSAAGTYQLTLSITADGPTTLPAEPTIMMGWDRNGNGNYPPNDPSDTAVIQGVSNSDLGTWVNFPSYFEMAHISFDTWGCNASSGSCGVSGGPFTYIMDTTGTQYVYFHDYTINNVNRYFDSNGASNQGEAIIWTQWGTGARDFVQSNLRVTNWAGYGYRGNGGTSTVGPLTLHQITMTALPAKTTGSPMPMKIFGHFTGVYIYDSDFDSNTAAWTTAGVPNGQNGGVDIAQCLQNVVIRNTRIKDFFEATLLQPSAGTGSGTCTTRATTNIKIDASEIVNTYPYAGVARAIDIDNGDNGTGQYIGDLEITNNTIANRATNGSGYQALILADPGTQTACGGDLPGSIRIVGNTFDQSNVGVFNGIIVVTNFGGGGNSNASCRQQDWVIMNNAFNARTALPFINFGWSTPPSRLTANNNVYNDTAVSGSTWGWGGTRASLANWQSATGQDANAKDCAVSFVNRAAGDYHLAAGDTCAANSGSSSFAALLSPPCTLGIDCWDGDRDVRPQ